MDNSAILTLISTLAGALIGGLFTWLSLSYQFKMKKAELQNQSELRARELLFESYQRKIEGTIENVKSIGNTFGQLAAHLQTAKDEDEMREAATAIMQLMKDTQGFVREWFKELETELEETGLIANRSEQLALIRASQSIDLDKITPDEVKFAYLRFMEAIGTISSLENVLLERKAYALFAPYINSAAIPIVKKNPNS